jgi:hypothetical protein
MLDLSVGTRSVAGIDLASDSDTPLHFYVLPPMPRLASSDDGPDIQLLRFVRGGELTGGHLHLAMSLSYSQDVLDRAQEFLESELKRKPVMLTPVPVAEATADLQFIGREPTESGGMSSILRRQFDRTPALLHPPHTATFGISLTPDGVRLMEAALRTGGAPIGVAYLLRIEGLWPAQRILARVNWRRVYDHLSVHLREGFLLATTDIQRITEELVENRAIDIQVVRGLADSPAAEDNGPDAALAWVQREIVERFCEPVLPLNREPAHASLGTLGEIFGVGYSFAAKKLTQIEQATGEIDLQQHRVVSRTIATQAHLADLLQGADPDKHISDAGTDHPFFQRMTVHVRTAQPLLGLRLKEAVLQVSYGTSQGALRLTPESPEATFEAWADAAPDRTWTIQTEIGFGDDSPVDPGKQLVLEPFSGQNRELTLDLKRMLGLAQYSVRAPVDDRIALSQVRMVRLRGADQVGEAELAIPPGAPPQSVWFRGWQLNDTLVIEVKYLLGDGRIVSLPPQPVESEILLLPPAFPGFLTVQLISDDDWSGLDRVLITLQKDLDSAAGTFVFDEPGKVVAVNLEMPDPTNRAFRYRSTRTLSTGVEEADDWITTDIAVVVVGNTASNRLRVDLNPIGPELPEAGIRMIEVELSYIDPEHQIREQKNLVIAARADRPRWDIAIQDPQRRAYEYRLTFYRLAGGPPVVGHWRTSTDRLLVIPIAIPAT